MQKMLPELRFIEPMECKPVAKLPEGKDWQYELKLDGYRAIAVKQNEEVNLYSRNGKRFNEKFSTVVDALLKLKLKPASFVLDGELVAVDEEGKHSFALLQNIQTSKAEVQFYLFDLLNLEDVNLKSKPLAERRKLLERTFSKLPTTIHLSPILNASLSKVIESVKSLGFEGIVAKNINSIYEPGQRSGQWQKHKTQQTDDFVIGGYIPGVHYIEQLVVGEFHGKKLMFIDSTKNGFVPATRKQVFEKIKNLKIAECPFENLPEKKGPHRMDREKMSEVVWVKPKISCELAFNERTVNGHLRHSKFIKLINAK